MRVLQRPSFGALLDKFVVEGWLPRKRSEKSRKLYLEFARHYHELEYRVSTVDLLNTRNKDMSSGLF